MADARRSGTPASEGRRPRIALFIPSLGGGGAERVMANLANGLSTSCDIEVIAGDASGPHRDRLNGGVRVVDLGQQSVVRALLPLIRHLRRSRPDALLSALGHANVVATVAARASGAPMRVVASIHNNMSLATQNARSYKDRILPLAERIAYRFADQVVAVSEGVADDFAALTGWPRSRIEVVYNPVVSDELFSLAAQKPTHPWLLGGPDVPTIMTAGRLVPQKDHATLLRAFQRVAARADARLVIFGDGPLRSGLENLASELGISDRVAFAGFVTNPYAEMRRATAFVLSSRWEGLPTVLIEALAVGCPVVSTNCPSGPAEILGNGAFGSLVPVGDPEALATAILEGLTSGFHSSVPPEAVEPYRLQTVVQAYHETLTKPHSDSGEEPKL